jgi:hypothetical protein
MKWLGKFTMILLLGLSAGANGEVVLEKDDNEATLSGTWAQSTGVPGFYGSDFAVASGGGGADIIRFFSPRAITSTGIWCIQARWTAGSDRTTAAIYQVYDGGTLRGTFTVDQRVNGGAWRRLGCVSLSKGKTGEVRLSDSGVPAGNVVVADGVRWVWEENQTWNYCIAVNGGFGSGGTTFVGMGFVPPSGGACRPWAGIMRTATTVVGTSTGAACLSNDGKLLTVTLLTTAPGYLGNGTVASDHIQLCPLATTSVCPAGGQFDYGHFQGPATQIPCTSSLTTIPSVHD